MKPFKYSGEHSSPEHSAEVNTTAYNEVITDIEGLEEFDEAEEEPAIDLKKLSMAGNSDLKKFMMRLALKKAMAAKRQEPAPVEIETR